MNPSRRNFEVGSFFFKFIFVQPAKDNGFKNPHVFGHDICKACIFGNNGAWRTRYDRHAHCESPFPSGTKPLDCRSAYGRKKLTVWGFGILPLWVILTPQTVPAALSRYRTDSTSGTPGTHAKRCVMCSAAVSDILSKSEDRQTAVGMEEAFRKRLKAE